MPDGYGGSGEGSGNQYGGGNGNGNNGRGNTDGNTDNSDNESAAESNRLAAANQAAANQAAADAANRASDARAQMDNSSMSAFSSGFQTTPENQRALSEQQTVRDFLARVEADKQTALGKPPESEQGAFFYNPNVGTNVANALDAAKASGVNTQTFTRPFGKSGTERDITSISTNIPIARFLGYTGEPGNNAINYGEAKMMQSLGAGDMSGVHLGNLTGTGLSVANAEGNPWSGITSENIGQTAEGIIATKDFSDFAEKVIDVAKHFVPGYGLIEMAANLLSGKMSFGDMLMGIGLNKIAPQLQMSPRMLTNIINMDAGNIMTDAVVGKVVKDLSSQLGVHPALVVTGLKETGSLEGLSKMLGVANVNANTTGKMSNAITNAASNVGVSFGKDGSVGVPTSIGDSQQEQIDRYLGGGYQQSTPASVAPASAPASPAAGTPISRSSSSLNALGALAFGVPSYGAETAVAPTQLASSYQTKMVPNQPKPQDVLAEFKNLQDADTDTANVFALKDDSSQGNQMDNTFYTYGRETPIEDILNAQANNYTIDGSGVPDYMKTGLQAATGGAIGGTRYGRYAQGGLSAPLMAHGGKMRVDFRQGDAVTGEGDGQSDDIPAMLADGEFVFPADVVAALGNGSTKAGSDKLYDMMHGIRAHVRSAKPKDLPPEIKSPLDFLKNTKRQGAKHG
jgi:hypothetical protein